jgi:hypothetical protein
LRRPCEPAGPRKARNDDADKDTAGVGISAQPITGFCSFVTVRKASKLAPRSQIQNWMTIIILMSMDLSPEFGADMADIIRFIPKSERERARLIREARAIYDSIFPPAAPVSGRQNTSPASGSEEILLS